MNTLSAYTHKKEIVFWAVLLGIVGAVLYYFGLFVPYYTFDTGALEDLIITEVMWGDFTRWLLSWAVSLLLICGILSFFFKKALNSAQKHIIPLLFHRTIKIISWKWMLFVTVFPLLLFLLAEIQYRTLNLEIMYWNLVMPIAVSQELLVRSIFIKYSFSFRAFFVGNFVLSALLSLVGFFNDVSLMFLVFSIISAFVLHFFLGVLAYKTQRIELPMLFHVLINLLQLSCYIAENCMVAMSLFILFLIGNFLVLPLCALNSGHKRVQG